MKPRAIVCMGWLLGVVLALGTSLPSDGAAQPTGKPAPLFSTKTLEGKPFRLRDLHGKVVLLDFWMVGCPPCVIEIPEFEKLHRKYRAQGLRIIAVTQIESDSERGQGRAQETGRDLPGASGSGREDRQALSARGAPDDRAHRTLPQGHREGASCELGALDGEPTGSGFLDCAQGNNRLLPDRY